MSGVSKDQYAQFLNTKADLEPSTELNNTNTIMSPIEVLSPLPDNVEDPEQLEPVDLDSPEERRRGSVNPLPDKVEDEEDDYAEPPPTGES